MHILFLTDNFPPEVNAPASRTYEHAREWVKLGHQVTIITSVPNFPTGTVYDGYKNKLYQSKDLDGIRVIRVWSYITSNDGFYLRTLDFLSYMITSFIASLFIRRPDVVIGTSPQIFTIVSAWAAAAVKRTPFVFELRDLWPESIKALNVIKSARILKILEKFEMFFYRQANLIISVTHSFKSHLVFRGIAEEKIVVITNGIDTDHFKPLNKDEELSELLDLKNSFVVGYVGTHGLAHGLETVLLAAATVNERQVDNRIKFLFVGDGAHKKHLVSLAKEMKLDNVIFHESVSKDDVTKFLSVLDISLIHLKKIDLFKTVIPSKMFESFGMGLPILLGVEGESADLLLELGAGITFVPENHEDLATHILTLSVDPQQIDFLAKRAVTAASLFDRKLLAKKMMYAIESAFG